MNEPIPPALPPPLTAAPPPDFAAEGLVDRLLRRPEDLDRALAAPGGRRFRSGLLLLALATLMFYALLMASFSGGTQYAAVPPKVVGGLAASLAICLPSLYILACLSGVRLGLRQIALLLLQSAALIGVLLAGFGPVAWIFGQSSSSVAFMGLLHLAIWLLTLALSLRRLQHLFRPYAPGGFAAFAVWAPVFVLVSLQMCTALRPLVGPLEGPFLPETKLFFLTHWSRVLGTGSSW